MPLLAQHGVQVATLRPSNCGFDVSSAAQAGWSEHFRTRFAGQPVKPVTLSFTDQIGVLHRQQGEFIVTTHGVEGSLIYTFSARLRAEIAATGSALVHLDLMLGWDNERLAGEVSRPRGSRSLSSHLQSRMGIKGVTTGLLRELASAEDFADPARLAAVIKALPLRLIAPRVRWMKASAAPAALPSKLSTSDSCFVPCPAYSAPVRCWTGKRRRVAICSLAVLPVGVWLVWVPANGLPAVMPRCRCG